MREKGKCLFPRSGMDLLVLGCSISKHKQRLRMKNLLKISLNVKDIQLGLGIRMGIFSLFSNHDTGLQPSVPITMSYLAITSPQLTPSIP